MSDRHEIYDLQMRYCRGIDRLDMDLVRSAYHPDGIDHHTGFSGPISEFVLWVPRILGPMDGTHHFVGNHYVEIKGDVAVSETYGQATHWGRPSDDPKINFTSGFRYIDHLTKVDGRWGIVERWAVREWTRAEAGRFVQKEAAGPSPSRDRNDPVFQLRRKLLGS